MKNLRPRLKIYVYEQKYKSRLFWSTIFLRLSRFFSRMWNKTRPKQAAIYQETVVPPPRGYSTQRHHRPLVDRNPRSRTRGR